MASPNGTARMLQINARELAADSSSPDNTVVVQMAPLMDGSKSAQAVATLTRTRSASLSTVADHHCPLHGDDVVTVAQDIAKLLPHSAVANPAGLGLGAFALTTFVLSVFNADLINPKVEDVVLPLALWYGGIAQVLAGMWEFHVNNLFGATAFTSYGMFWLSFATLKWYILPSFDSTISSADKHAAIGLYLLAWTIFTFYMWIASFRISKGLAVVFSLLEPAFILLTIGAFKENKECTKAGGWFGIFCAAAAWYCAAAPVLNTAYGRQVLPVGHFAAEQAKSAKKA